MLKVGDLVSLKNHPTDREFWVGVVKSIVSKEGYSGKALVFWPAQDKCYTFLARDLEIIT
jgi:hypothetical protein